MRAIAFFLATLLCAAGLALAFTLPLPAHADAIAQQGADWVRIMAVACTDESVKAAIVANGEEPAQFLGAVAHIQGQDYHACWRPTGRGVFVVYEDGDRGNIPEAALKPVPEA